MYSPIMPLVAPLHAPLACPRTPAIPPSTIYLQKGVKALHVAAAMGHSASVHLLLDKGANKDAKDEVVRGKRGRVCFRVVQYHRAW